MSRTIPPETLTQARHLFDDGASQSEVQRTTGLARETLRKHFPGKGWTYKQGGEFRQLTRERHPEDLKRSTRFPFWEGA